MLRAARVWVPRVVIFTEAKSPRGQDISGERQITETQLEIGSWAGRQIIA